MKYISIPTITQCHQHSFYSKYFCSLYICQQNSTFCNDCSHSHKTHQKSIYSITELNNKISKFIQIESIQRNNKKNVFQNLLKFIEEKDQHRSRKINQISKYIYNITQIEFQQFNQILRQFEQLNKKIKNAIHLLQYFNDLKQKNLLLIKLKVSSTKGLTKYQQKINWLQGYSDHYQLKKLNQLFFTQLQTFVEINQNTQKFLIKKLNVLLDNRLNQLNKNGLKQNNILFSFQPRDFPKKKCNRRKSFKPL